MSLASSRQSFVLHVLTSYSHGRRDKSIRPVNPIYCKQPLDDTQDSFSFDFYVQWIITAVTILMSCIFGYVIYDAVMATASELLQSLLVISPLLLVAAVHWFSLYDQLSTPIPGSEPVAIHQGRGSTWGVAFIFLLLVALICFQPALNGLIF